MLSSRHALVVWLVIGALLVPAAYALLPTRGDSAVSGVTPTVASAAAAILPTRTRVPSELPTALPVPRSGLAAPTSPSSSDVSAQILPTPASAEIHAVWNALHYGTNGGFANGWVPPDVILSAGPVYVVEMVNLLMGVYTKTGTQVQITPLATFFNSGTDFISDPKVQYDPGSGRWFATVTDVTGSSILLAVSSGADPTGSWHHFTIAGSACLDQPILGVGTSTVILSTNDFSSCTSNTFTYVGAQYWVISKADLLAGVASPAMNVSTPDVTEFSIHPAQIEGTSSQHYMVSTFWPGSLTTSNTLHVFTVSGTPPAKVTVTLTSLSMSVAAVPPAADQLGTNHVIDTSDIRVSDAVWSAGKLWLGFDEACQSTSTRACIRLAQVDTSAGTLLQDFDIDVSGKHVFYPGLRVDGVGNLAAVFGYASSVDYPGIMVSGQLAGDAPNTLAPAQIVTQGSGPENPGSCKGTCRYGDYFGAALDPTNASIVWLAGEMGTPSGWSTHVFSVTLKAERTFAYRVLGGGTGYTPPVVSSVHDGVRTQTVLSTGPTTLVIDPGTEWTVSPQLPGSSASTGQIWALNASAGPPMSSGWANTSTAPPFDFDYYHQYAVSLDFGAVGGAGYTSAPQVTGVQFGSPQAFTLPLHGFLDANSSYSFPSLLDGSTSTERWQISGAPNGTVSGPVTLAPNYYHQVLVSFAFAVQGLLPASGPIVRYSYLGGAATATANATEWADSQAAYSYDAALAGASPRVRWGPGANGNGTVTVSGTILVTYHRQFLVLVTSDPAALGSSITGAGWYDEGASVTLSALAPAGWRFDRWSGDASGTSTSLTVPVATPLNITARFDAGLTITAGEGGSISYAYGSTSGTVPAGTAVTIYVPVGTSVTLVGVPGSWSQTFGAWSGAASGTGSTTTVQVNAPGTVGGSFGLNVLVVGGLALLVVVVIGALVLILVRRRRKRPPA